MGAVMPSSPYRSRTSRRALLRVAGAATAAAVAAACTGDSSTKGKTASAATAPAGASSAAPVAAAQPQSFPDDPRVRMQHLLRRASFTPSDAEVGRALDLGQDRVIDALLNPGQAADGLPAQLQSFDGSPDAKPVDLVAWWLGRMAATATPSLEKMTLFWHGFHTSGFDKVGAKGTGLLYQQNVFQRTNAFGSFPEMLKGISRQPAMMLYLDTATNVKGHANENFSREMMELFSMGVGTYTETDVREAARAFTGYSIDRAAGTFIFRPRLHDDGAKTVLGQTGNFSGDDVVDIVMQQQATPRFVARKVWSFFAYPNPDDATIAPVAQAFSDSGGDMRAVMRAVLTHPAFMSGQAYRALVKSPIEYSVGAVRQLGVAAGGPGLAGWGQQMGQVPFYPPNVAGWPGGAAWMGTGALFARLNGVNTLLFAGAAARATLGRNGGANASAGGTGGQAGAGFDIDRYLDAQQIATAGALVDHLLALLVDGQVEPGARAALVDYASGGGGDGASLTSMAQGARAERVLGAAYLIMASPEYQLS